MRVAEFIREIKREGWRARIRPGGHIELSHPDAVMAIITSATPSDHRWVANTLARMRRALPLVPKPERPAAARKRRSKPRHRPAPARAWPEPLAMYRLPEPERRFYPPEPVCARLPGGPSGFRSCLDRT
jgi:predicted RNA binding protein YcfA (HicA-like mRNA interferase family)